jgi:hypothetical protein
VQPLGSSQHFMEPEGALPSSQELSTCTYPERFLRHSFSKGLTLLNIQMNEKNMSRVCGLRVYDHGLLT